MSGRKQIFEGDPCPARDCYGEFVWDTAFNQEGNGDFLRCDTCHLRDDQVEVHLIGSDRIIRVKGETS